MNLERFKAVILGGLLCIGVLCISQPAFSGITGSSHDFSGQSWNTSGEICKACHTPHNANTSVTNAPLWNHTVSSATYTLYSSDTLNAHPDQPDGSSKLCLSCHDGTVALDSFGRTPTNTTFIDGDENVGADLSNDHPVSFTYDSSLATADGELADPSISTSGIAGSSGTIEADMLRSGKVQCSSCHDVHNSLNNSNLLVKSNAASALCLTCHTK